MRIPPATTARYFRCVKCGVLIDTGAHEEPVPEPHTGEPQETKPPETKGTDPLVQLLTAAGLVSREHVAEAREILEKSGGKLFDILIRQGHLKKEALHSLLSRQPGAAGISLAHFTLGREMVSVLPQEMVVRNFAIPIDRLGKLLTVAMVCPLDMEAISEIQETTGLRVKPMLCSHDDFQAMLQKHYRVAETGDMGGPAAPTGAAKAAGEAAGGPPPSGRPPLHRDPIPVEELRQRVRETQRLEVGAKTAAQITALVGTGGDSLRLMADVAAASPPLAATLLATANSAAYGMPGMVDSLPMAMALLGEHGVNLIASNMRQCDSAMERHLALAARHARKVGNVASALAGRCGVCAPGTAQAAGLLYAAGSFALAVNEPEEYRKLDRHLVGAGRNVAEKQVFGLGHAEAGGLLLVRWGIPAPLHESVRHYADPDKTGEFGDIARLLAVTIACVNAEGAYEEEPEPEILALMDRLGLTEETVRGAVSASG